MAAVEKHLALSPGMAEERTAQPADFLTVAGMAAVIYCLSVMLHEAGGHGGACLAVGAKPLAWGAFYFDCDTHLGPPLKWRVVAGAGSTVNLIVAVLAGFAFRATPSERSTTRLALTLALAVNLFTWAGYFLFSGISGIGDWGDGKEQMLWQVPNGALWRGGEFAFGVTAYLLSMRLTGRLMGTIFGGGPGSRKAARLTAWTAYFTGSGLSLLIGLLNPVGIFITLASAAASSFGGTAGFWGAHGFVPQDGSTPAPPIRRSWPWIVAGVVVAAAYAAVLGRSIRLA
jgi:hypothetical protein